MTGDELRKLHDDIRNLLCGLPAETLRDLHWRLRDLTPAGYYCTVDSDTPDEYVKADYSRAILVWLDAHRRNRETLLRVQDGFNALGLKHEVRVE